VAEENIGRKRGMIPIYRDRNHAENYWKKNIQFKEFHSNKKEKKVMKQKIRDAIKNKDGSRISKIVQSISISPKSKWKLQAGS
jgi:hypothetical protein